jgi:VWFA-related protein
MSSPRRRVVSFAALVATWLVIAALDARPQNPPARPQDPTQPTFRSDASYVRVDVYPTADGVPVTDLRRDDFEVLEDNKPQTIDAFEHVQIRGGVPQELRAEPNTVAELKTLLQNPRARAFVIFLDTNHVEVDGSHHIRQPLISALDRMIGPEDLVGIMTPEMSAADVTFARRTTTIEGFLTRYWTWGQRDRVNGKDPNEEAYRLCYPGFPSACVDDRGIADEMIVRRREKMSLDAMDDLVRHLAAVREERTAVLAISDGWVLYRPNTSLGRSVSSCQGPPVQQVGIDPRTGRITTDRTQPGAAANPARCEADRQNLAQIDDYTQFQTMLDRANRSNVSFYPIDPRGLVVFDSQIDTPRTGQLAPGQSAFPPPSVDSANLRSRLDSLRNLASATDGIAIINSNDLESGLRRVTADLSSYYLLSYYSTGQLDGKFHAIRVRVKRPGVQVRARRGYLAPTAAEAANVRVPPAVTPSTGAVASAAATSAVASALASLGGVAREGRVRMALVGGWKSDDVPIVWAVGEFGAGEEWRLGADVDLMLTAADGRTLATAREHVASGSRSFRAALPASQAAPAGDYTVRIRAVPAGGTSDPVTDLLRITVPSSGTSGALVSRRGPATTNREVPTADLRFRRNEQIRIDRLSRVLEAPAVRLLDRSGNAMSIPIAATVRTDPDGTRWISASLALSPLAPGDYLIELAEAAGTVAGTTTEPTKTLVAFRMIP